MPSARTSLGKHPGRVEGEEGVNEDFQVRLERQEEGYPSQVTNPAKSPG